MARQRSTIGHNPLTAVTTAEETDMTTEETNIHTAPTETPATAAAPVTPEPVEPVVAAMAEPEAAPAAETVTAHEPAPSVRPKAMRTVYRYMAFSAAAGLSPLPAVDAAAAAAVQVKMLHAVAKLYGVAFNKSLAKQIVVAMIGGGGSVGLAIPAASAAKAIPVVGTATGMVLSPAFATASCYATGRTFVGHFENGGTLESFDASAVQAAAA
jgi:uncharacterized protein (DUF697 family)